jgi:tRNA wybutosine-synthesizing protein 2
MFAGIGYFALPIAKYCNPKNVVACEKNPVAYGYLNENTRLNRLENLRPVLNDCRRLELEEKVDRIVMGYVKDTGKYLPKAFELIGSGGTIHYHEACPVELLPERPTRTLESHAKAMSRSIRIFKQRIVKSYAPKVAHVVVDLEVT